MSNFFFNEIIIISAVHLKTKTKSTVQKH